MRISRRALVTVVGAAVAALSMAFAAGAFGAVGRSHRSNHNHRGQRHSVALINESLAPSEPTDPTFHGVTQAGRRGCLKRGEVRLKRDGKLDLRVKGFVIPALGTPGPATTISGRSTAAPTRAPRRRTRLSRSRFRLYRLRVLQRAFHLPRTRGPRPPERARDDLHRTGRLALPGSFRKAHASGRRYTWSLCRPRRAAAQRNQGRL
jgi:hypothetical protein